jgi:hypothetical protein
MRTAIRVTFVAVCTALFIAGGLSPRHTTTTNPRPLGDAARAAPAGNVQQPSNPAADGRDDTPVTGTAAQDAKRAAQAAVPGATVRGVEREVGDDDSPRSAYEVELVRPDGSTVEVDLDASFKPLATGRGDGNRNDD